MAGVTGKNKWTLLIVMLCGLVIGGFLGYLCRDISWLSWLNYGQTFGLSSPVILDLGIIVITFGLKISINICSILGILISIVLYKLS